MATSAINEEIGQLLSFTSYGKVKLDTLTSQLNVFEKNLRKLTSRPILRQLEREVDIFNVTLVTTLDSIGQWRNKVALLQHSAQTNDELAKKQIDKITRLVKILTTQQNRIQGLQIRYQRLAKTIQNKFKAVKPNIILGREPLVCATAASEEP